MTRTRLASIVLSFAAGVATVFAQSLPKPDLTVAADGSGDFKTIQAAVASIPRTNRDRIIIFIKDGLYNEKVRVDASFVTLLGQSRAGTRIEFAQNSDTYNRNSDGLGTGVINVNGDDFVLQNLTVKNTHGVIGPHAVAIFGTGDKTVITDCDVLSQGADTLSLWPPRNGHSYQARLNIRGSVDFVCPHGWSYMTDCTLYQVNPKADAAIWHDGSKNPDMKFVLRNCQFDGADSFILARHHHDAQFFLIDCKFSKNLRDAVPKRVIYPLDGSTPTDADIQKNRGLDPSNLWGERAFYYNCHRDGGDYPWFANNLSAATNAPTTPDQITAAWTFAGTWNPENKSAPVITQIKTDATQIAITFSEPVTTKGKPRLALSNGAFADYISGSGTTTLVFAPIASSTKAVSLDLNDGAIIANEASATLRSVNSQSIVLPLPGGEGRGEGVPSH